MNRSSSHINIIKFLMRMILLFGVILISVNRIIAQCDNTNVPNFVLDLSGNAEDSGFVTIESDVGPCCGTGSISCFTLELILNPNAGGFNLDPDIPVSYTHLTLPTIA